MNERKHYIDNLRWAFIVFLVPFHASMAWYFDGGNYVWFNKSKVLSSLVTLTVPWYMPLLFVLAGISARYALKKRSYKEFCIERIRKLFVPLIMGTFTVVAYMAYMADKFYTNYSGSFIQHYGIFISRITDMTGYDGYFTPGHLWFLLYLFIISMVSLLIISMQKKLLPNTSFSNTKAFVLLFLLIFPVILTPILDFGGKSIGADFALYLLGYYILSEEQVLKKISDNKNCYLGVLLVSSISLTYLYIWKQYDNDIVLTVLKECSSWFGILTFIGFGRCIFNQNNKVTKYMTSISFMFYIFHFPWLVFFQYYLSKITNVNIFIYIISILGALVMTLLTCEVVKRIPVVRVLFGAKK